MKNFLTSATKRRVIRELRQILYQHPKYRGDHENVQNKYSFEERPQRGIIVNSTSADRVRLSADNYMGSLTSFIGMAPVDNYPGTTLEWVRENYAVLEKINRRRNVFPTAPGVYILEVKKVPDEARGVPGEFTVDPMLTVLNEPVVVFSSSGVHDAQLPRENIYPGSLDLWIDGRLVLTRDVDYSIDYASGHITFLQPTPTGLRVYADYRYAAPQMGPFLFNLETSDETSIPGAVLAFGDRAQIGDKQALVVTEDRTDVSLVYGGKFEVAFELLIFTRDAEDREKMSDYVVHSFMDKQNELGFEGIEILEVSPGGENEDVAIEGTDEYFYDSSVSVSMRVDWESYVALPLTVSSTKFTSSVSEREHGYLGDMSGSDLLKPTSHSLRGIPTMIGKDLTYERLT